MSQMKSVQDLLLSNVSSGLFIEGYISEKMFPVIKSAQTTGKLGGYGTNHLRLENTIKGGRGKYRRVEPIVVSTSSYSIDGHGLEGMVTKEDYRNKQNPFDAEKDETIGLQSLIWLEKEYAMASALSSTSVLTQNTTLSGTSQFSDYNNSDPISKFRVARQTVRSGCGVPPNMAWMDWAVWNVVRYHPQILDALGFKDNRPGGLTEAELASAMGVDSVLIAKAVYETAVEGQTSSLSPVWGKHIGFGVLPASAQKYQVSLGYEVRYDGEAPRKVYKWDLNNPPESTAILCEDNYDQLIANALAGYLIKDAIA